MLLTLLHFRWPVWLAWLAVEATSFGGATFWKTRSSVIEREEEEVNPDLGLDPGDVEGLALRDQNWAVAELEVESAQVWASAAAAWARAGEEPMWPEMPAGMEPAATVFMPPSEGERSEDSRTEVVDLDREVWNSRRHPAMGRHGRAGGGRVRRR